jgi:hypothetical protein
MSSILRGEDRGNKEKEEREPRQLAVFVFGGGGGQVPDFAMTLLSSGESC